MRILPFFDLLLLPRILVLAVTKDIEKLHDTHPCHLLPRASVGLGYCVYARNPTPLILINISTAIIFFNIFSLSVLSFTPFAISLE